MLFVEKKNEAFDPIAVSLFSAIILVRRCGNELLSVLSYSKAVSFHFKRIRNQEKVMLRKMHPGQPGTIQFKKEYGDRLVCVRYRYDAKTCKRIKTIEIIVAETEWQPPSKRFAKDEIVWVRIGFVDRSQQQRLRAAGGKWDSQRCVWNIRYDAAVKLGLAEHVERRDVSP